MKNKGIMLYLSQMDRYSKLSKDEWYDLSFAAMNYANSGEKITFQDRYIQSLYEDWCKSIDEDYAKYQKKAEDNAERVRRHREKVNNSHQEYNIPEELQELIINKCMFINGNICTQTQFYNKWKENKSDFLKYEIPQTVIYNYAKDTFKLVKDKYQQHITAF